MSEAPTGLIDTRVRVAVDTPQHSGLTGPLDYLSEQALAPGSLVRVPLGKRELLGIVWPGESEQDTDAALLRPILGILAGLPPLSPNWCALVEFAAQYYQRTVGELALSVLPPQLRELEPSQLQLRLKRVAKWAAEQGQRSQEESESKPQLSEEQAAVLAELDTLLQAPETPPPVLLYGVTGSGKTEVYLRAAEHALAAGKQVLVLVPEINLTPQLEARFAARFAGVATVSLHSGLTPAQRLRNWLAAHLGEARLVLGTLLAVFASMPQLGLIVVDEEHDPSYKQQDGARYSARDLAVYRARLEKVPVILGSATPSLESWQRAEEGKYKRLALPQRIGGGALPRVRLFDMKTLPISKGVMTALTTPLLGALRQRLERGEQSLVFLNRRGYAPVLHCGECNWKSDCPHCSA